MTTIWVKYSGCWRTKERNLSKQSKNTNTILISSERHVSNLRTNSSSSRINLAGKMLTCLNLNSRSIIYCIKIKIWLLIMRGSNINQEDYKNYMVRRSMNQKLNWQWRQKILRKLQCNITENLRNSRNRVNSMQSS